VNVAVGNNGEAQETDGNGNPLPTCTPVPTFPAKFVYTVTVTVMNNLSNTSVMYSAAGGEVDSFKINGDGGICTGSFDHQIGNTLVTLHPHTAAF
jgi:hypothetical protein